MDARQIGPNTRNLSSRNPTGTTTSGTLGYLPFGVWWDQKELLGYYLASQILRRVGDTLTIRKTDVTETHRV